MPPRISQSQPCRELATIRRDTANVSGHMSPPGSPSPSPGCTACPRSSECNRRNSGRGSLGTTFATEGAAGGGPDPEMVVASDDPHSTSARQGDLRARRPLWPGHFQSTEGPLRLGNPAARSARESCRPRLCHETLRGQPVRVLHEAAVLATDDKSGSRPTTVALPRELSHQGLHRG
jgi:hypothetical protein